MPRRPLAVVLLVLTFATSGAFLEDPNIGRHRHDHHHLDFDVSATGGHNSNQHQQYHHGRKLAGCTCVHVSYPCYATYNGKLSCWSMDQDYCQDVLAGEHCARTPCVVDKCESCSIDGQTCYACESGYIGPACETEASFFADVKFTVLEGGIVALASPKLHKLLADGYAGAESRALATESIVRAFTREFKDNMEIVVVYPSSALQGSVTHQEFFGAKTLGGTSRLNGMICGGNPGVGGAYLAVLHELAHNFVRPHVVLPNNFFYSHWGLTSLGGSEPGMLGGYTKAGVTCASPAGRIPSHSSSCNSDVVLFDSTAGSTSTSNDFANQAFPLVELWMMGLASETELKQAGTEVAYCPVESYESDLSYDETTKVITAQCNGGLQVLRTTDLVSSWTPTGNELSPDQELRVAVIMVFDSEDAVFASAASFDEHTEWAARYFGETLPPAFAKATRGRASVSFTTSEADRKGSGSTSTFKPTANDSTPKPTTRDATRTPTDRSKDPSAPTAPAPAGSPTFEWEEDDDSTRSSVACGVELRGMNKLLVLVPVASAWLLAATLRLP